MASLTKERVTVTPPFTNTRIELYGPFYIKYKNQHKGALNKIYVAIFICFSTRTVHLEILSNLTSDALIATSKRFFAHRVIPSIIFSDNGTQFSWCSLYKLVKTPPDNLASYLISHSIISWKFLPPRSPNFGGLCEAGIKSFKYHLKRTIGNFNLTIEEFLTVVNQVESIINSGFIIPLSSDPNDFRSLTPGHFLISRPINSIPESKIIDIPDNPLSRWQQVQKINQFILKERSRDNLNNLQQRGKWKFEKSNIQKNSLVLLKEENLPSSTWPMG
ncbi:integrase catalytic domain-containing protein [Trichonephila clavipes]|nr:integrase catalytic domain-containing protein [Trichonephila clavipes]